MLRSNLKYLFWGLDEKTKEFSTLISTFDGWQRFALLRFGLLDSAVLYSRYKLSALRSISVSGSKKSISVSYSRKTIGFYFENTVQLDNAMRNIYEVFVTEQWSPLRVNGKVVVDVGANNADSSLYFAVKGAKQVYAYEPYPYSFRLAAKNVSLNGMGKMIKLNNEAVLGSEKTIAIDAGYESVSNTLLRDFGHGKRIKTVTLDRIVGKYGLRNAVLKMDCEGSEYEIIANAKESSLRSFDEIGIEYHFGYAKLVSRLKKAGFRVRYTEPKISRHSETNGLKMEYGMIYAYR